MACWLTLLLAVPADAQLNGSHSLGDFSVQSGSQPALLLRRPLLSTLRHRHPQGCRRRHRPAVAERHQAASRSAAVAPMMWYVSKTKLLGANYGAMVVFPFANASLEAPAFSAQRHCGHQLFRHADPPVRSGFAHRRARTSLPGFSSTYLPAVQRGGSDNIGKGMWTYQPFFGTTFYFDEKRSAQSRHTAYWEIHGKKKDSDVKVGQLLTLQGGLGKSFLGGGLILGAAYYGAVEAHRRSAGRVSCCPGGDAIAVDVPATNTRSSRSGPT